MELSVVYVVRPQKQTILSIMQDFQVVIFHRSPRKNETLSENFVPLPNRFM